MDIPKIVVRRKYAIVAKYSDGSEALLRVCDTFKDAEKRIEEFEKYKVGLRGSCGLLEPENEN